ncbi:MAG: hypothetical protein KJ069_25805 [Anaerolineae bacterium]|nr:hypothetical protein [Anaerolineae bacterium]
MFKEALSEIKRLSLHIHVKRLKKLFRLSIVGLFLGFALVGVDMTWQNVQFEHVNNNIWTQRSILTLIGLLIVSISGIIYFGVIMTVAWRTNNPHRFFTAMGRFGGFFGGFGGVGYWRWRIINGRWSIINWRWRYKMDFHMARFLSPVWILLFCVLFFSTLLKFIGRLLQ